MSRNITYRTKNDLPQWDYWLARFYHENRKDIYPNEISYWKSICKDKKNVLEIGAGNGFISKNLLDVGVKTLTLVEPEYENLVFLNLNLDKQKQSSFSSTNIEIFASPYQMYDQDNSQDVIFTSWDNLAMFSSFDERLELFQLVAKHLKSKTSIFCFHLSSEKFNYKDYLNNIHPKKFTMHLEDDQYLDCIWSIEKNSEFYYSKKLSIKPPGETQSLSYTLPTWTVLPQEIHKLADLSGLKVLNVFNDFDGGITDDPDDYIWILGQKY